MAIICLYVFICIPYHDDIYNNDNTVNLYSAFVGTEGCFLRVQLYHVDLEV